MMIVKRETGNGLFFFMKKNSYGKVAITENEK